MPQCVTCSKFFPPGFLVKTEDGLARKCIFCETEKEHIEYWDNDEQRIKIATKQEIVNDYLKFCNEIAEQKNIKKLLGTENE